MKYWLLLSGLVILLGSCEKKINFALNPSSPSLVVEATIENGQPPLVILSRSFDYFGKISPQLLAGSFVHGAVVKISNGQLTHQLKEYTRSTPAGLNVYYYSTDSASLNTAFTGSFGGDYMLEIQAEGKRYTGQTTIPLLAKKIDSLWWKKAPANPDTNKVVLVARITDPPGLGDYIRYFTRVGQQPFYPGFNSVFDDQVVDGKTYTIDVERGVNRNEKIDRENYAFFERGDTITVKFCNIDKATYDFWRTMEYSYSSIGNPFSSPTQVLGNIKGTLGYFGGYAAQYKTLVVPK